MTELLLLPPTKHLPADWILRLIAYLMAGPTALTAAPNMMGAVLAPALGMHVAFSLAFGYLFCGIEDLFSFWSALLVSVVLGLAIYLFNFHVMTSIYPWFATVRGGATVLAHVLFGVTTTVTHKGLSAVVPYGRVPATSRPR